MVKLNQKRIGFIFVVFSIVLLIILTFIKVDADRKGAFFCELISESDLSMEECPVHKNNNSSWLIIIAFGIAFVMLFAGLYLIFIPLKKEEKIKEVDLSKLDENEKNIYNLLKQREGSMYQSDLIKETGFSKVQITRILDKMEARKIIGRERRGMTNIIILK